MEQVGNHSHSRAAGSSTDLTRPRGGPQTHAGKDASRRNALQHGLASQTLLDDVLGPDLLRQHLVVLQLEFAPTSPMQELLVRELARHAAALERIEQTELAMLRTQARNMERMLPGDGDADAHREALLAAAATGDGLETLTRYRRSHEVAFYSAWARLRELQMHSLGRNLPHSDRDRFAPANFASEQACEDYLLRRWQEGRQECPHCGHRRGAAGSAAAAIGSWASAPDR